LLLACAREYKNRISCHTICKPRGGPSVDYQVARYIARTYDLEHEGQHFTEPTKEDLERWLVRTGFCVAGASWRNVTTVKELDESRARLTGIGGEIGRAYYRSTGENDGQLSPTVLMSQLKIPTTQTLWSAAEEWLADAPALDPLRLLDLLYVEQRVGCWASPATAGHTDSAHMTSPFCDREIVRALIALGEEKKRSEEWMEDIIRKAWPQLLDIPFDQYAGWPGPQWPRVRDGIQSRLRFGYLRSLYRRIYQKIWDGGGWQA